MSIVSIARQSRLDARAGVHIGEFDANRSGDPVLEASAAIAAAARDHEVRASRTVIDLLAGSGLTFDDRGRILLSGDRPLSVLSVHQSERA
jgi:hypothetical protein